KAALAGVHWPGRLERLGDTPPVLYDGAHTPESAAALARALAEHFPGRRRPWPIWSGRLAPTRTTGRAWRLLWNTPAAERGRSASPARSTSTQPRGRRSASAPNCPEQ